jgi:hypothetical protein
MLLLAALRLAEGKPRPRELQPAPVVCSTCPGGKRASKKGSGTVVRSTLRAVPATVPDPFLDAL